MWCVGKHSVMIIEIRHELQKSEVNIRCRSSAIILAFLYVIMFGFLYKQPTVFFFYCIVILKVQVCCGVWLRHINKCFSYQSETEHYDILREAVSLDRIQMYMFSP